MRSWVLTFFIAGLLTSCYSRGGADLKVKGSDTEVNLVVQLAEHFHTTGTGAFISVSGGGSGLGITALLNGTADIANASRSINATEIFLFAKKGIEIDSFVFAQDAVAIVVNAKLPVDSLTISQLKDLLEGSIRNWKKLGGEDLPVNIYGRQSNSGTHEYIQSRLGIEFSNRAKEMNGNAQILEAIKQDRSGIGYVGAGYVNKGGYDGVKVIWLKEKETVPAVSPLDEVAISDGRYFFQRPLFQYFLKKDSTKARPFINFEKSETGRKIIADAGYYPWKND